MKKNLLILALILSIVAVSCVNSPGSQVCTKEGKLCPDGTYVGRDINNDCQFFSCKSAQPDDKPIPVEPDGGIGTTNPYVKYASTDPEECKLILFQCIRGSSSFSDETGCGCKADEPKKYVGNSADECSRIRFVCETGRIYFSDEKGCGCEFTFDVPSEEMPPQDNSTVETVVQCTQEQKNNTACTMEYLPVCGDDNKTYGNICSACASNEIDAYIPGECPAEIVPPESNLTGGVCTEEQKAAEACTMEYMPVCGDNSKTYGNICSACSSKEIDNYTPGECKGTIADLKQNSVLGDNVTISAVIKNGNEIGIDYCAQGLYLSDDTGSLLVRTGDNESNAMLNDTAYLGKKVVVSGIYPAAEYFCEALICSCEDYILATNISLA